MNDPPPPGGGVFYQEIEVGPPIDHYPITGKVTRLKWDRATGTLVIDPDQPKPEAPPTEPPGAGEEKS